MVHRQIEWGGGVIIKAHTVNLSEVFYSQTLKESEICKITLSRNCSNVYFSKSIVNTQLDPGSSFYNLTSLAAYPSSKGDVITIPKTGVYWIIPFDPIQPIELQNGGSVSYECYNIAACSDQSTCDKRLSGGVTTCMCQNQVTTTCQMKKCFSGEAGGNICISGGGILIEAFNLVQN